MHRRILFSKEQIDKRVNELALEISRDYQGVEPVFVGLLKGVIFFFSDLLRAISIPARIDFIRAESYGNSMESSGNIRITKDVEVDLRSKHVIVVDDIVDTGLTLSHIVDVVRSRGAETIKVCALIDKMERRTSNINIDYWGFRIEKGFVVGYGLDYAEKFRCLPDIYVLEEKVNNDTVKGD